MAFYSTVAVVLPVLFLAAMVEMRLSATVPRLEGERPVQVGDRVFWAHMAMFGLATGEVGVFLALWNGVHRKYLSTPRHRHTIVATQRRRIGDRP
jgi:hypothetical protein